MPSPPPDDLRPPYEPSRPPARAPTDGERRRGPRTGRRESDAFSASDAAVRRLAESGIVGVFFWRLDGAVLDANDALLAMLGHTREELDAGRIDWRALTPPEYEESDRARVAELHERGHHGPYGKEYVARDGRRVPVVVASAFLEGTLERGVSVCVDMSEVRRAGGRVALLQQVTAALAGVLSVGAVDVAPGERHPVHDAIEARQPVLVQDREVLGTRYPGLAPVAARAGAAALVAVPLVADGGPPLGALLLVLGTRHAPAGGDLPFLRAVAQQCAQAVVRVRLYEAERRARLEAVAAHRTKSEFLATMSHELRTPLNAITGYLQLLELEIAGPLTARQRAYLGRLGASGQHLLALINDILDLSRLDAGRMPLARERALAGHTLDAALILVLPQARERGVRIVDACQRAVPGASAGVPYVGDEDRVRQVLVNLLSNAVKFTPAGGTITVDCALADDAAVPSRLVGGGPWTVLRVTDTGIGIAPEHQTAIFEPFRQVEGGHTRRAEGTGLGLAISRRLARLMGGDLMVESRPGAGATFSLWLPAPGEAAATSGEPTAATLAAVAAPPAPRSVESDDARGARALGDGEPDEGPGALASIGHALRASLPTVLDTARSRLRADPVTRDVSIPLGRAELDNHQLAFLADVVHTLLVLDDTRGEESDQLRDGGALQRLTSAQHGRMRHRRGWREEHLAREYAIVAEELTAVAWRAAAEAGVAHADAELAVAVLARLLGRAHDIATMAMRRARENAEMREG